MGWFADPEGLRPVRKMIRASHRAERRKRRAAARACRKFEREFHKAQVQARRAGSPPPIRGCR